jgi:hypothetical protein
MKAGRGLTIREEQMTVNIRYNLLRKVELRT